MFDLKRIFMVTIVIAGLAVAFGVAPTPSLTILHSALAAPVPAAAQADTNQHPHRYYDPYKKDYHEWTNQEDHAYREWLRDQHRDYRDFGKLNKKSQREYWQWRHEHPEGVR